MQQMPMNRHLAKPLQSLSEVPNEALWCYAYIMEASQDGALCMYAATPELQHAAVVTRRKTR
jgi:hypothetical protein